MKNHGFSLVELLLATSILVILATFSLSFYRNYAKNVELDMTAKSLVHELRNARARAMGGEDRLNWGIHLVNDGNDYYEIFSTPTDYSDGGKAISSKTYLPQSVGFSDPAESSSLDIVFNKITGATTADTLTLVSEGVSKTLTVSASGSIN